MVPNSLRLTCTAFVFLFFGALQRVASHDPLLATPDLANIDRLEILDRWLAWHFDDKSCRSVSDNALPCTIPLELNSNRSLASVQARPPSPPQWWQVTAPTQLDLQNFTNLGNGVFKQAMIGHLRPPNDDHRVVIKIARRSEEFEKANSLHLELVYLEYLRWMPGIPWLYGAFFDKDGDLSYVVEDAGEQIGRGGNMRSGLSGLYCYAARSNPLALVKAIFAVFESYSEKGGFILTDFKSDQFTLKKQRDCAGYVVYLVDGPLSTHGDCSEFLKRKYPCPNSPDRVHHKNNNAVQTCCFVPPTEPGASEPSSPGDVQVFTFNKRVEGSCRSASMVQASKHVSDVATREWLLPFIIEEARQGPQAWVAGYLETLIPNMTAQEEEARPSFKQLLENLPSGN